MEYTIDAKNKTLGRLAVEIAIKLRGKDDPRFDPARLSENRVVVKNTDTIRVSGKKLIQKTYKRHSGFHGGLKQEMLRDVLFRDSRLALRRAVMGMLPKNRLRARWINNLILLREE